jgi:hypothetical protein
MSWLNLTSWGLASLLTFPLTWLAAGGLWKAPWMCLLKEWLLWASEKKCRRWLPFTRLEVVWQIYIFWSQPTSNFSTQAEFGEGKTKLARWKPPPAIPSFRKNLQGSFHYSLQNTWGSPSLLGEGEKAWLGEKQLTRWTLLKVRLSQDICSFSLPPLQSG